MTVQAGPTFKRYVANGVTTVFAIPFLLLDAGDLVVTLNDVPVTSGFTLTGIGDPSSTATFTSAPIGDLLFRLVIPFQRLFDYQENGDFLAGTVNDDFDRIWLAMKELSRYYQRALKVSDLESEGLPDLPSIEDRIGKLLSFDAYGNPVAIAADSQSATDLALKLADGSTPLNGSGIIGHELGTVHDAINSRVVFVGSILELINSNPIDSRQHQVTGYMSGTSTGGGLFAWSAIAAKSNHDGREFISPTVPWDGTAGGLPAFLAGTGETVPGGLGCWVRMIESHEVEVDSYGGVTAATLNNAVLDLDTGNAIYTGGQIAIPVGQHSINSTVNVNNSSAFDIQGVTLRGRGKQASTLDFTGQAGGQNGIDFLTPIFAGMEDMGVRNSATSGVKLTGQPTIPGSVSWNHFNMDRVRLSFNGKHGLEADRGFMGHFNQVFASHNVENGFRFDGLHTSLLFNNCYGASNTLSGFSLVEPTYSVLNACAADTNGIYGYLITKAAGTVLNGCGSESNGRAGFAALASTALGENKPIILDGFFAFNNNTANAGFPNAVYVQSQNSIPSVVIARGCRSFSPANPTVDALVDGVGAYLVDEYNDFPNGVAATNGGYIHHIAKTKVVPSLSVVAATNVVELQSTLGGQTAFTGEILVTASNQQPSASRNGNIATYKLLVHKDAAGVSVVEVSKIGQTTGAGASAPSFTWSMSGNFLRATPVGSTSSVFFFEVFSQGGVKAV